MYRKLNVLRILWLWIYKFHHIINFVMGNDISIYANIIIFQCIKKNYLCVYLKGNMSRFTSFTTECELRNFHLLSFLGY